MLPLYLHKAIDAALQTLNDSKFVCNQIGMCDGSKSSFKLMHLVRKVMKKMYKLRNVREQ